MLYNAFVLFHENSSQVHRCSNKKVSLKNFSEKVHRKANTQESLFIVSLQTYSAKLYQTETPVQVYSLTFLKQYFYRLLLKLIME